MTLPGADTMKGGIIGDDCLRCIGGGTLVVVTVTVEGILTANCAGIVSTGEESGVWVACDEVVRG